MGLGMNGIKFAVGTQPKIGKRDEKEGNLKIMKRMWARRVTSFGPL